MTLGRIAVRLMTIENYSEFPQTLRERIHIHPEMLLVEIEATFDVCPGHIKKPRK